MSAHGGLPGWPHVVFVNRFFYPDHSASSQILSDLAFYLADRGVRVHVIASRLIYDDPGAKLPKYESLQGVEIHRVATTRFGRHSHFGRTLDYASFYVASVFALLRVAKRGDVVVIKTDPPMLSILVSPLGCLRGFKVVNWLQDIYPEIASILGIAGLKGVFGRTLTYLRNASLRSASMNVAIGNDMAERVGAMGVPTENLKVVTNWSDDERIAPTDVLSNPLRADWGLEGKFVVGYSGNLGRAHDIDTVLSAAESLRARSDIVFLFVGGGRGFVELEAKARARVLDNIHFRPYQPRERLSHSLGVADLHWLSLKPSLDGLILPSKFYGIAAAGRPILVLGSPQSELAELVSQYDCGLCVMLGEGDVLARAIVALAEDASRCREMGVNARRMLDMNFTKSRALARWHALLDAVGGVLK